MPESGRPSPTLAELQAHLFALITGRVPVNQPERGSTARRPPSFVRGDRRLDATGRIAVYSNMYFFRLLDVMRDEYPKLFAVLGRYRFQQLAADYLDAFPSRHPSVRHLGGRLPGFLDGHPLGRRRRWLGGLARLEWARSDVHDRRDEAPLSWSAVVALGPERLGSLTFRLVKAHQLVGVEHAVADVWRRLEGGERCGRVANRAQDLVVWRRGSTVYHRVMLPDEAVLLPSLVGATPFASVCDLLGRDRAVEVAAQRAAELLLTWTNAELMTAA